ncbi:TIGR02678 family protein [Streptomyces sp. CBMA156]|uniref:TIGR02678 family protein n=1 Tax=Streptomyces sp. CBMA156 TaxID=1930280 RepID=UPI0016621956|nr:TIGR02678 family protein [Streptomyces sp. CBMA156]MBD0674618.1 TIGR02678 family protein [Streptomyces sp. CBMA156]
MSTLANQLVLAERQDVARGVRLLLGRPLITERGDPSAFELVRRRQGPLTKWFDYNCGWQLVVEPRLGYARLFKIRAVPHTSRPARRLRSGRAPFDRRRYTLLCVVAAELLPVPVTTVGLIADRVVQACAADEALPPFDTAGRSERMAFVDVLKLLEAYGALLTVDGVTESFVDSAEAKVLYRVDATVLMRLLAAPVGPSRLAVPAEDVPLRFGELLEGTVRESRYGGADASDAQRNLGLRHSVLRRLLDDPVLHHDELRADELAYLTSPTGRQIVRRAAEQGGFVLEERADGLLLVDPDGIATDSRFPDDSATARVAALLLLDPLTAAPGGLTPEQLAVEANGLLRRFPQWAKGYQSEDGAQRLTADAVRVLTDFGLAGRAGDRTVARPAAFRYRSSLTAATAATAATAGPTT